MKALLKRTLKVPVVNLLLRSSVRWLYETSLAFTSSLIRHLHVSGVVRIRLGGHNIALASRGDDALTSKLYYFRRWEEDVVYWFSKFCGCCSVFMDAGANIGLYSLLAAKETNVTVVYAFEPNPRNFLRLRENIALNDLQERVFPVQTALGASSGNISFYMPADDRISDVSSAYRSHTTAFNHFDHSEIRVPVITLSEFCRARGVLPDIVKIDVELYELQVLQGMTSLIESRRPVIFCEIFNDVIKRKLNSPLDAELEECYTEKVEQFIRHIDYYAYAIVSGGLLHVDSLQLSPRSNMYLLLPKRLDRKFYVHSEHSTVLKELGHD